MQTEQEIKELMCDIGRRVYNRGMVAANDGNFSVKLNEEEILCTPTGVSKGFMTPEYICKVNRKGEVLEANGSFRPSSEIRMHLRVYDKRPDVGAVEERGARTCVRGRGTLTPADGAASVAARCGRAVQGVPDRGRPGSVPCSAGTVEHPATSVTRTVPLICEEDGRPIVDGLLRAAGPAHMGIVNEITIR